MQQEQRTPGGLLASGIILGGMSTAMWQVGESGEIAGAVFGLASAVAFLRGIGMSVGRELELRKFRRGIRIVGDYGGAKWASLKEVRRLGLFTRKGIYLGRVRGREIRYDGPSSVAIVAQARSGKGTNYLLQTLLTSASNMVIADPKGELAAMTGEHRRKKMGHDVFYVNPWRLWGLPNHCYNPLEELRPGDRNIRAYAAAISAALLPETAPGANQSSFWTDGGRGINTGLMIFLKLREPDNCTLMRLRALTHLPPDEFRALLQSLAAAPPPGAPPLPIVQLLREFAGGILSTMEGSGPQHAGVLAEAMRATEPFDDLSEISDSLRRSDFSFRDLKHRRMTVYLMIPTNMIEIYRRWYQLLLELAIEMPAREAGKTD